MLAHLYYINTYPISFWVIVPVCSLVLGCLVWRSRTIASSMVAHATINALGFTAGYLIATFLR
jgi:membrane protease YdiL (CAAX protease family)